MDRHFSGVAVNIRPLRAIEDKSWAWHIGLDAESTAILNGLWRGEEVEPGTFRRMPPVPARFRRPRRDACDVAGQAVYLALSMARKAGAR